MVLGKQVLEEVTALKILEKIKFIGDNQGALFILDREMSARTNARFYFILPSDLATVSFG